eukprot:4249176-Heterocapsa_arctica.AAC.2
MRCLLPWAVTPGNVLWNPGDPEPKGIMKAGVETRQPGDRHGIRRVKVPFGVHRSKAVVV